jgi:ethanolamine utilization microcompartment shell protein EutS
VLKSKRTEECGTSGASEERLERKRGIRNETASVIGVIQLTGSIVTICSSYLREVKSAQDDIITLQRIPGSILFSKAPRAERQSVILSTSNEEVIRPVP